MTIYYEGKAKDDELETFEFRCINAFYVEVEAKTEDEARKILEKKLEQDYDYPTENYDSADGWEIE